MQDTTEPSTGGPVTAPSGFVSVGGIPCTVRPLRSLDLCALTALTAPALALMAQAGLPLSSPGVFGPALLAGIVAQPHEFMRLLAGVVEPVERADADRVASEMADPMPGDALDVILAVLAQSLPDIAAAFERLADTDV